MLNNILNALKEGFKAIIDRPKTQIPEFDGLRSLAVLLVISTHAGQIWTGLNGQSSSFLKLPFVQGGWVGVDLFFCLSGFFIGRQLWKEYLNTKTILPIKFIMRRGLRIWPLFYTVLILNGLYIAFTKGITFNEIWPELFLVSNYFSGNLVPGSWSLSTEEQFYLVIPLLVLLVSNHFKSIKPGFWFFVLLFF